MLTRQDKWLLGAYFVGVIKKKWMRYLGAPPHCRMFHDASGRSVTDFSEGRFYHNLTILKQ